MLRNFIVDDDLVPYDPLIREYQRTTQSDFSTQISQAFDILLDDMRNRGRDVRKLGIPLDLKRDRTSTAKQNRLTFSTETGAKDWTGVKGETGFRRLVVNATAFSGTELVVKIQGSDDLDATKTVEPTYWEDITSLSVKAAGEVNVVFQHEYRWYRISTTFTGTTVTFSASLWECTVDHLVIHQALFIIYRSLLKTPKDRYESLADMHLQEYVATIESAKFMEDKDDDQLVDAADSVESAQGRLQR